MAIITLNEFLQVWQLRAQWSDSAFNGGESSWSFIVNRNPSDDGTEVYDLWATYLQTLFCSARPDNWVLERVLVEDRWPHVKASLVVDYPGGLAPDSSGPACPVQVSPIITWYSGYPGRSYRGRTYFGQMRAADLSDGWHVTGDMESVLFDFAFNMYTVYGPFRGLDRPAFGIVSRQHDLMPRDPPVYAELSGWSDRQYVATVRKRNHTPQVFG